MHDMVFYAVEYIAILTGAFLIHKYVYCHKRKYDLGSFYLTLLAGTYIWIVTVCMHVFGITAGFAAGIPGGGLAVFMLDFTAGVLYNSGY